MLFSGQEFGPDRERLFIEQRDYIGGFSRDGLVIKEAEFHTFVSQTEQVQTQCGERVLKFFSNAELSLLNRIIRIARDIGAPPTPQGISTRPFVDF